MSLVYYLFIINTIIVIIIIVTFLVFKFNWNEKIAFQGQIKWKITF